MTLSSTEQLIAYWRSRKRGAQAPRRADIDPAGFPKLLPQVFILGRQGPGEYVFRLVGGLISTLHGRDLRGVDFVSLLAPHGRVPFQTGLEVRRRQPAPLVVTFDAQAGGLSLPLDVALMPLANAENDVDRFLGIYDLKAPLARLRDEPAERLSLVDFANTEGSDQPRLRLAASGGLPVG